MKGTGRRTVLFILILTLLFSACFVRAESCLCSEVDRDESSDGPGTAEYYTDDGIVCIFSTVLIDLPSSFPLTAGDALEGADGSMLVCGAVYGDEENGTLDFLYLHEEAEGLEADTVLSILYSLDYVALLEMDEEGCVFENEAGYYLAAFDDDGPMTAEEAAARLNEIASSAAMELNWSTYDAPTAETLDLRAGIPEGVIRTGLTPASFAGKKLIMLNLFESWCGPCLSELDSLERLYETYKDDGFVLLGAFQTANDRHNIEGVIEEFGLTFPITDASDGLLRAYNTGYVPTTVLFDGNGQPIADEVYIGAKDYASWEALISKYL